MGATSHGTQTITWQYFQEATGANWGKRLLGILPPGIYSGGYLTRVSDIEVTLSTLIAEIKDGITQINIRTAAAATLNSTTLNSGTISSATPYLVLRWAYALSAVNYVDVHAISSVSVALANDIVIGKCLFSGATLTGFNYSERTFLNIQDLFFKVETSSGLYVQLRAGRIHTSTGYVLVPEQLVGPFNVPSSSNSRIDLIYIDANGIATILQGTQAVSPVAPSYGGELVVAEVTLVNGDVSIPAIRIRDVRSFLTSKSSPVLSQVYDSGWFAVGLSTTYTKFHSLGSEPIIVLGYLSDSPTGSGRKVGINNSALFVHDNVNVYAFGTSICRADSSSIKVRTGIQSLATVRDENGAVWQPTSGYVRIIAMI